MYEARGTCVDFMIISSESQKLLPVAPNRFDQLYEAVYIRYSSISDINWYHLLSCIFDSLT